MIRNKRLSMQHQFPEIENNISHVASKSSHACIHHILLMHVHVLYTSMHARYLLQCFLLTGRVHTTLTSCLNMNPRNGVVYGLQSLVKPLDMETQIHHAKMAWGESDVRHHQVECVHTVLERHQGVSGGYI